MKLSVRLLLLASLALLSPGAGAAERTTYFVPDAQGSPVAAMDERGNVLWRETYAPWGERKTKSPDNNAKAAYTGKLEDTDTGLVYMGARMYDPETGRFTGVDPQGFKEGNPQSFGRYLYANNSPYRYVDLRGEAPTPLDALLLAWDAGGFALALYSGSPAAIAEAGESLGASLMGMVVPVPGAGLAIKAERAAKAAKATERAADSVTSKALVKRDPDNNGALFGEEHDFTLLPGTRVDRYGYEGGHYLSPAGTPKEARALRSDPGNAAPTAYTVAKPVDVKVSTVAPAYGQTGLGQQYRTMQSVGELRQTGKLIRD